MAILNHGSTIRTADGGQTTTTIVTASNIGSYAVASNATYYIGTTQNVFNRASGAQTLTGVSIDGNAANITAYTINQNVGTSNTPSFAGIVSSAITNYAFLQVTDTNNFWITPGNNNWGLYFETSAGGLLGGSGDSNRLGFVGAGAARFYVDLNNGNGWFGASLTANTDSRAPIFYDSGNTSYYLDPANTSTSLLVAGNVGIGTTSPSSKLHIDDVNAPWITISRSGTPTWQLRNNYPNNQYGFSFNNTTAGTVPLFIGAGGNIGLGIDNPSVKLDIANTQANGIVMRYDTTTAYQAWIRPYWNSGTDTRIDFAINRNANITPDVIMSVGYGSNVGIGTTSPGYKLDITGDARIASAAGAGALYFGTLDPSNIYLKLDNSYDLSLVQNAASGNGLYLAGAGNVYVSIDSNNNGTTDAFIVQNNAIKAGTELFRVQENGVVTASTDFRAPIFYDSNDTAYYLDPANTSLSLKTRGYITINNATAPNNLAMLNIGSSGSGETRAIDISGGWSGNENKSITFTHATGSTNIVAQINAQHNGPGSKLRWGKLYHGGDSSTYTMELISESTTSAYLTVAGSVRSPIFYDSDNTSYYINAAGASSLNTLTMAGTITGALDATASFTGGVCTAASYNYILNGANDTGNKLVIFVNGSTRTADGGVNALTIRNDGGSFILGQASYLTSILGSSVTINSNVALHAGNYNSYAPTLTGTGASGSWGISVTGNAATATILQTARTIGGVSFNGSANIDLPGVNTAGNQNTSGNAATATNLSTNRTNWSTNGTITAVVGQLAWKHYGNGHTIIDASNSTSPAGGAIGNTNPDVTWTGTYPTLMGWNGANTYGVRVDSSRYADQVSYSPSRTDSTTYPVLWGAGTSYTLAYSCASVYIQSSTGSLYANAFYDAGNTAFYIDPASESNLRALNIDGGTINDTNDATLYITAQNDNDWGIYVNKNLGGSTNFGIQINVASADNYGLYLLGGGSERFRVRGNGTVSATGDFRAPIFYDSDNTSYYVNAASTSSLNALNLADSVDVGTSIYIRNNLRMLNSAGNGWLETIVRNSGSPYFTNPIDGGTFLASDGAENNNWLFQENARGWGLFYFNRGTQSGQTFGSYTTVGAETFIVGQNSGTTMPSTWTGYNASSKVAIMLSNYTGYIWANDTIFSATGLRAPIFYDSNDTTYYIDPASTSRIVALWVRGSSETVGNIYVGGGSAGDRLNINYDQIWTPNGNLHLQYSGGGNIDMNFGGGHAFSRTSLRAPIFYDFNNTAFYTDPASTSVLNRLTIDGGNYAFDYFQSLSDFTSGTLVTTDIPATAAEGESFVMNVVGKSYSGNTSPFNFSVQGYLYNSTIINFSGLSLDSTALSTVKIFENGGVLCFWWPTISYWNAFEVSVRAYNSAKNNYNRVTNITNSTEPTGTKKVTVTLQRFLRADVSATNSVDLRAPIFYDSNDTTYYTDPSSLSNILELKTNRNWYDSSASAWGGGINMGGNNPSIGFQSTASTWWYMLHHSSSNINFYRRSTSGSWNHDGIWDSSGNLIWQGSSVRAPIFYDQNNTSYYLDPANSGTSLLVAGKVGLGTTSAISILDVRGAHASGYGIINVISTDSALIALDSTGARDHGIRLKYNGVDKWLVGMRDTNESYSFSNSSDTRLVTILQGGNVGIGTTSPGEKLEVTGRLKLNNSGYGWLYGNDTNHSIILRGNRDGTALDESNYHQFGGTLASGKGHKFWTNGVLASQTLEMQIANDGVYIADNLGIGTTGPSQKLHVVGTGFASSDFRAPIFYDSNDTNYYIDAASTSQLNQVASYYLRNLAGVSTDHQFGLYFNNSIDNAYAIYREGGAWTNPYPDLRIAFHTGIKLGANAGYNGIRFYNDYTMATQVMSVNNSSDGLGADNVYVNNSLQAGSSLRAPIFYDSNNTAYYCDPNSTSNLYYIQMPYIANGSANILVNNGGSENWNAIKISGGNDQNGIGYSNTSHSAFGRNNLSFHIHSSDSIRLHSSGWDTLFEVAGSSGNAWLKGGLFSEGFTRLVNPGGAYYVTSTSSVTGAIKIRLPRLKVNTMMRMTVKIYQYNTGQCATIECGGYDYSGDGIWRNIFAYQNSDLFGTVNVRFGNDGTYDCIWIGETSSTWSYPQVFVTDFQAGYGNYTSDWGTGWSISYVTAFDTVTDTRVAYKTLNTSNVLYVGTTSIALNRSSASQTLTGVSIDGNSATTTLATKATRANGNFYIDDNYGNTVVGLYAASRYQGVFAMGDSYKLATDGTTTGTLYGIAWSHPNAGGVAANLNTHGALIMENGTFLAALSGSIRSRDDMRTPIYYDSNDTAYYVNPNGTSRLSSLNVNEYYAIGWFRNSSSGNGLYNEATGQHFYSDSANYWNVASSASAQGIRFRTGGHNGTVRGYIYADTSNSIGLLNQDGNWRLRVVDGDYSLADGSSMRAQIFYDSNDTAFYLDPAGTSNLNTWTSATSTRIGRPIYWTNRLSKNASTGYHTGSNGWGVDEGTWANAWKGGFSGWDIWGSNTDHPQGSNYVHAQGIVSGVHFTNTDGSSAYGWMMVGAANATSNRYWLRGKWDTAVSGWVEMLTSGNYNSFSPTLTGTGASGSWGISITGNAATVTNGMYLSGTQTITGINYFRSDKGSTSTVGANSNYALQAFSNDAGAAGMSFHRGGYYAVNMGLDPDNVFRIGGWSASANRWELDMSGNNWVASSFRAPIFYDSNDTGYYLDPNSTSNLLLVRTRNTFGERVAVSATASTTINTQYNVTELTLAATITTLTLSNIQGNGIVHMWTIITVGGGVPYSITWPAAVKWPGGTAPTLTTSSSKRDIYQFVTYDGGTNIFAIIVGQNL